MTSGSPRDIVICEAVRTPVGRRGGGLSTMHSADLLGVALKELIYRSGIGAMPFLLPLLLAPAWGLGARAELRGCVSRRRGDGNGDGDRHRRIRDRSPDGDAD